MFFVRNDQKTLKRALSWTYCKIAFGRTLFEAAYLLEKKLYIDYTVRLKRNRAVRPLRAVKVTSLEPLAYQLLRDPRISVRYTYDILDCCGAFFLNFQ